MNDTPFYIGLGIHKSATTWIYTCLYEHPDICIPNKDIHFFYHDHLFEQGYDWYENSIIKHHNNESTLADFSVIYLVAEHGAERIKNQYPEAKLFVCLRNPVDRAWSHYLQDLKKGHIGMDVTFEQAIELDNRYILFGQYKRHLEKYLSFFTKDQIRIFLYDDIQDNPALFVKYLYDYMGVEKGFQPKVLDQQSNRAMIYRYPWVDRFITKFSESLKSSALGQSLWWKIKSSGLPNFIRKFNRKTSDTIKKPDQNFMDELRNGFDEDIIFVKEYLNRPDLTW